MKFVVAINQSYVSKMQFHNFMYANSTQFERDEKSGENKLFNSPFVNGFIWWGGSGSNRRPTDYENAEKATIYV